MNCRNCAAAMELFERRRYYYCRYCGTFEFLDAPETDGIRVLERRTDAQACPLCQAPLAKSLLDGAHTIQHCEKCRGALLERAVFAYAVSQRRAHARGPGIRPVEQDRRELQRRVSCPSCRTAMDVHPYYGPGNVVIDTCRKCDLVWLDFGELQQITDAPGLDRGQPPKVTQRQPEGDASPAADEDSGQVAAPMTVADLFVSIFGGFC
jgi:Zn-finger nucleic acid-binding protein